MPNPSMPPGTMIPCLSYPDVGEAVEWLETAFGFRERLRIGEHRSQLVFGDGSMVVVAGSSSDRPVGHSVMVRVGDVDAIHRRAEHGARVVEPPTDHAYGERQCTLVDPGGHAWTFTQSIADVDPADWGGTLRGPRD